MEDWAKRLLQRIVLRFSPTVGEAQQARKRGVQRFDPHAKACVCVGGMTINAGHRNYNLQNVLIVEGFRTCCPQRLPDERGSGGVIRIDKDEAAISECQLRDGDRPTL
jgi:hypothetical protein